MKNIGIIIQARVNSTRLSRKVLLKINNKTIIEHLILRLKKVKISNKKIILATTKKKEDNILEKIARKHNILFFRGSEKNVLDRFFKTAFNFNLDIIIRITADCPLIDYNLITKIFKFYSQNKYDYVSNTNPPTFPDGYDIEIFSFKILKNVWQNAFLPSEKEHLTQYIIKHPQKFKINNFFSKKDYSYIRLTLDEKDDYNLIKRIFKELPKNNNFKNILNLLKKKPELLKINQHIKRNEGLLKSLKEDEEFLSLPYQNENTNSA